jgi:hypothetical protein
MLYTNGKKDAPISGIASSMSLLLETLAILFFFISACPPFFISMAESNRTNE